MCYGEHIVCAIDFAGDQDKLIFTGRAGDEVHLVVCGFTNDLDLVIEVRDSTNTPVPVSVSGCTSPWNGTCRYLSVLTLPLDGSYTVIIEDDDNVNAGNYGVHLEKVPSPDYPVQPLWYNAAPLTIDLGHCGDHDFVTLEAVAGSDISINVNGASNDLDPRVQIFDPSGQPCAVNADQWCGAPWNGVCNYTIDFPSVPLTGTYTLLVTDDGWQNVGNVNLTASCNWSPLPGGLCPDPELDVNLGSSYCTSNANSSGNAALLTALGSASIVDNRVYLLAADVPGSQFGLFFASSVAAAPTSLPAPSQGLLCVGLPLYRFGLMLTCDAGTATFRPDLGHLPFGMNVVAGDTWNFQAWFRDLNPGATSNTTDAVAITFTL
jgi:hypothetical protein